MPDIIRLLSDHIANQIAAGEVIQRPASAIKELLENAVDAGATDIQVHLRDAGKELIQVIDNGKGMSPADARMAFERHATSKISDIADLFTIRTMGFRGEALASIAAVAQVELRTCPADAPLGTRIVIEGTEVKLQEPTVTPQGTNLMLKNLFFNVPARRHFLKSNMTEMRHILDEFTRVAMAYPEIGFTLWHGDAAQMRLEPGNLKLRIIGLLGSSAAKNLVPVEEEADVLRIRGFIGKPEAAAKSRGSQFFFINNRFIRSPYLHHAVSTAYGPLIPKDAYPFYVLFLEIDPARVDVNVHPTKQEVKFEDDRLMYAYLQAAVKHALARYNISPSLDFSLAPEIQSLPSVQLPVTEKEEGETRGGYLYNTFSAPNQAHRIAPSTEAQSWRDAYKGLTAPAPESMQQPQGNSALPLAQMAFSIKSSEAAAPEEVSAAGGQPVLSVQGSLLVTTVKSGLLLVHLRRARERIWHERLEAQWAGGDTPAQRLLFPVSMELPPVDGALLAEVLPDLRRTGFDISPFGAGTFVIQGTPPGLPSGGERDIIEEVVNNLKHHSAGSGGRGAQLLIALSKKLAYSDAPGTQEGLRTIIDELFACGQPEYTATGKKVFAILPKNELDGWLG